MTSGTDKVIEALADMANGARTVYTPQAKQIASAMRSLVGRCCCSGTDRAQLDKLADAAEPMIIMLAQKIAADALALAEAVVERGEVEEN